ncbi:unnamed protein product [Calypogeia fissa]
MTRDLSDGRGPSISAPRLESRPSGSYIDFRFSRQSSHAYQPSFSESYDSEDYIDLSFPGEHEAHHIDDLVRKLQGLRAQSRTAAQSKQQLRGVQSNAGEDEKKTGLQQLLTNEFKDKRFLRNSDDSLRVDVEDFYTSLTIGLDSLNGLADSFFLTADFMQQSITFLQALDDDVRTLLEKLSDLKHPRSDEFCQSLLEYTSMSGKILEVCNAVKFATTLLKKYQSSQAEASVVAVEALVALPKSAPRAVHIAKAEEAGRCIDRAQAEMTQMQAEVKKYLESSSYGGSLSYLVPSLNVINPQSDFAKWSGLWGVLFAMKAVSFYISQLLLAGLAHADEGPAIVLSSTSMASFNSGWALSLVGLHVHVRKQFNKMKDNSSRSSGGSSFMSRDNDLLGFMLRDTKGHLQSLLDQGKFLNIGVYLGSWQADKKKLVHNVPRLRQHLLLVRYRLSKLIESIESLAGRMNENISDGQRHLDQM